ncbi:exodeoxyribonuclease V subunit gamma [Dokdonella soli]|uniref:RecBCD enzyme subunit RecC n=1 Tax=Dokdonella soli TaxID=529810 RepID=A0ABN1IPG5_9GAMM
MDRGIAVYRASRLEALLDPLVTLMDRVPPANPLAPHTLIAAHPGIRQWLARALARKRGVGGIVANVDIHLPSAWLDELAHDVLGESVVALRPYRREALRWRIHAALDDVADAQVAAYLRGNDLPRRRFQLADRLARVYTRYLVYRPDWLKAWAAGRDDVPEPTFLAPLWRALRAQIGLPHRGELLEALAVQLRRKPPGLADEPLHVFGISHLAPSELAMLRAVARHRLVVLYVPDPCVEYWAGLPSERTALREMAAPDAFSPISEQRFLDLGHPLLASWGRLGQHFMLALHEGGDDVQLDLRHWQDEARPAPSMSLLQRVQESVRRLDPALICPGQPGDVAALADRSLRVHACHTRLRELEVLRDALLRERAADASLKPSDIVVMAPDIQAYVPLLASVFGEAGRHQGPLPYHLADVAIARSHRIFTAFERLLALPQSRLTAPEVMDLLEVPEIARALGLEEAGIDVLGDWLRRARVAWGLDAAFREGFDVPGIAEYTFAWGMDRLLGGYVFGQAVDGEPVAQHLADGSALVPLEGVHGPQTEVLGALDRLLRELAELHRDAAQPRAASAWCARMEQLIDALFRVDPTDAEARDALVQLRRFVRALEGETRDGGLDPMLDFAVVREVLVERLGAASERQRFLMGGVTFCGMVPQRAIPFRVIAVLGLDDGEFPRTPSDAGLDLMVRHRRLGDRDVRSDDRYLFLETLMAARDGLHLSYIGEGVRDGKARNPAAPLAELLGVLDDQAGLRGKDTEAFDRPWRVRHPLQPFDARYFDGADPRLFSFRADLAALAHGDHVAAPPFLGTAPPPVAPTTDAIVPLREVLAYYKDPARQVLRNRLDLRLDALEDDALRSSEPLDAQFERIDRVGRRLFFEVLDAADGFRMPDAPPDWLRLAGLWPPGRLGDGAWIDEATAVQVLLDRVRAQFADGVPAPAAMSIDRTISGLRIQGELARVRRTPDAWWVVEVYPRKDEADLAFGERIGYFLEWALLRLHEPHDPLPVRAVLLTSNQHPWQDSLNRWAEAYAVALRDGDRNAVEQQLADLQRRVGGLLTFWADAQRQPVWYFPKTSWAAASGKDDARLAATWIASGDHGTGERDYAPGYAALLARDARFEPGQADLESLKRIARQLHALISFEPVAETLDE